MNYGAINGNLMNENDEKSLLSLKKIIRWNKGENRKHGDISISIIALDKFLNREKEDELKNQQNDNNSKR